MLYRFMHNSLQQNPVDEISGNTMVTLTNVGQRAVNDYSIENGNQGGLNAKICWELEAAKGSMMAWQLAKACKVSLDLIKMRLPVLRRAGMVQYNMPQVYDSDNNELSGGGRR